MQVVGVDVVYIRARELVVRHGHQLGLHVLRYILVVLRWIIRLASHRTRRVRADSLRLRNRLQCDARRLCATLQGLLVVYRLRIQQTHGRVVVGDLRVAGGGLFWVNFLVVQSHVSVMVNF